MNIPPWTAQILLLCALLQILLVFNVGRQRSRSGIQAPAMSGDAALERAVRTHMNTLEQFGIFLPTLLVAAAYAGDAISASLGAIWIAGRVIYAIGYQQAASRRGLGFAISALALVCLWLAAAREFLRLWLAS